MAFPPQFLDELRSRLSLAATVGRRVRLTKRGREHTGLCPFHNEKSPSFTVSDDKGFYHCFGCGAHGDAIEFIRRSEGLSFTEAVERLAQEAGLPVPAPDPQARERAERHGSLQSVLETAADWYQSQLQGQAGAAARRYLQGRGLSEATIARFRLGFAPDGRMALKQALLARNLPEALLVETGMLIKPDDGGMSYDRFRDRIMFPITDRRGRVIAFGGRALGDIKPKYLNSPDTPLFHKGHVLYNLALAREAANESGSLIVAEGYMDVIALAQAGFAHAVAPLGTALTEEQMALLWRLVPEPILCFDGDAAGWRAALRAAERCLPLLKPGHSFRFALLPAGEDPDSLLKAKGPLAMSEILQAALPLAEVLWRRETDDRPVDTPERRAAVQQALADICRTVGDEMVRGYYRQWFKDRLAKVFEARRPVPGPARRPPPGAQRQFARGPLSGASLARMRQSGEPGIRREQLLIVTILNHPALLERIDEDFAGLEFTSPELDRLRRAILHEAVRNQGLDSASLQRHLSAQGLTDIVARLTGAGGSDLHWFARPEAALADAEMGWKHALSRHRRAVTLRSELRSAEAALAHDMNGENLRRLQALKQLVETSEGDEAEIPQFGVASGRESAP